MPFDLQFSPPRRRAFSAAAACSAAVVVFPTLWLRAVAQNAPLRPTPAQTEGPFYPEAFTGDVDTDLLETAGRAYRRGQASWVQGRVLDVAGRPVAGATVEIWQCDEDGHYRHSRDGARSHPDFQGFGRMTTGADGAYRFRALRPVAYAGRTPHIHFKLRDGARELLTTQLYVEGDPDNARDGIWRRLSPADRAAVTRPFAAGADGVAADFPIVIAAR